MPTKFTRRTPEEEMRRREAYWRMPRVRQRLLIVYIGLSLFSLLLIVYLIFARGTGLHGAEILEAPAVVVSKEEDPSSDVATRYHLTLDVDPDSGSPKRVTLATDPDGWTTLEVGDRVRVRFQKDVVGSGIKIQNMYLNGEE